MTASEAIKKKLEECGESATCYQLNGGSFDIKTNINGVRVFINGIEKPTLLCFWRAFDVIVESAREHGGKLYRGERYVQAGAKLGSDKLPLDSIEGIVAYNFHHKVIGSTITRRSNYYTAIMEWAGICKVYPSSGNGSYILLNDEWE